MAAERASIRRAWIWLRTKVRLRTRVRELLARLLGRSRVVNEHFVPGKGQALSEPLARGDRHAVHHLVRYRWAEAVMAETAGARRLLDIACGSGYGSYGLARRFPELEVIGADYDAGALGIARAKYAAPNLSFVQADVTRWDPALEGEPFDVVVSFDTIEHVSHREIMLQNVVEHLRPDGLLLLSTPVRSQSLLDPAWEHHEIEFSAVALYDFLSRYFREILAADLGTLPRADVVAAVNAREPIYSLRMNPLVCRGPVTVPIPESVRRGRITTATQNGVVGYPSPEVLSEEGAR